MFEFVKMEERFWKQPSYIARKWKAQWWPVDSLTVGNICQVRKILEANDCFTLDNIGLPMPPVCDWSTIHTVIHDVLQLQKLSCQWVLCILTNDHMARCTGVSLQFLTLYYMHSENILDQVITGDKIWVHKVMLIFGARRLLSLKRCAPKTVFHNFLGKYCFFFQKNCWKKYSASNLW